MLNPRKDPNHAMWDGCKFDILDASFCVMVSKNNDVLIYCQGDDNDKGFFLPGHNVDKIIRMAFAHYNDRKIVE